MDSQLDSFYMLRAIELAARGEGHVEPNPMVGCVVMRDGYVVGEGWHKKFGGDHAEVEALKRCGAAAAGSTIYVTLEPCCHQGKTPPCADAIVCARPARVVVAMRDPFSQVNGQGIAALERAGIAVEVGLLEDEARRLNAPYLKLIGTSRPWVIAKWAMTLDGKIATSSGASRWISGDAARSVVHKLRGRVDAIAIGSAAALADDPALTARPPGPRQAMRIVLDTRGRLPIDSQLVRTAREGPVLIAVGPEAEQVDRARLTSAGCEVLVCEGATSAERVDALLVELGRRRMTNVLVEGGGRVLGSLLDAGQIDEVHAFIAPRLVGGIAAPTPIAGKGLATLQAALHLEDQAMEIVGADVYIHGRIRHAD